MGRLHGQDGKEGALISFLLLPALLVQVVNKQMGQLVGFIAGKPVMERLVALTAMYPAIPWTVVVFVSDPIFEAASPLHGNDMVRSAAVFLLEAVQMPFADISGIVTLFIKHVRDGRLIRRQLGFVHWYAAMRINTGQYKNRVLSCEFAIFTRCVIFAYGKRAAGLSLPSIRNYYLNSTKKVLISYGPTEVFRMLSPFRIPIGLSIRSHSCQESIPASLVISILPRAPV